MKYNGGNCYFEFFKEGFYNKGKPIITDERMIILEGLYHIPVIKSLKSIFFFEKNRISSASLQKLLHQPLNMKDYKSIHFPSLWWLWCAIILRLFYFPFLLCYGRGTKKRPSFIFLAWDLSAVTKSLNSLNCLKVFLVSEM